MPVVYADISNTYITRGNTGIQRVVRELSRRLAVSLPKMVFIFFSREKGCYYKLDDCEISLNEPVEINEPAILHTSVAFHDFKPKDIFIDLDAGWGDPLDRHSLLSRLKAQGVIIVCMHYDAVPVLFPDFSHPDTVYRYTGFMAAHLDLADYFICISNTVKKDLEKLSLKITNREVKAFTLPLGSDFAKPDIRKQRILDNPDNDLDMDIKTIKRSKYLIAVGTLEPRKNHQMLLKAFDLLDDTHLLNLVIVGKKGWNIDDFAQEIENRPDFGKKLFWLKNASDTQLRELYKHAFACVNISHYEGYGLPVIEALSHNCVTLCSNGGTLEEVASNACHILAKNTADCLATDIMALHDDPIRYDKYKEQARNFIPPTWDDSCQKMVDILNHIKDAQGFNWDFIPKQAIFISIEPTHMALSVRSVIQNMDFIKDIILLTADKFKNDMEAVLEKTGLTYTIITDEEICLKFQVNNDDFTNHTRRNTFLRMALFKDEAIDPNFISFDDDYLVQKKVDIDFFINGTCHSGFYFLENADQWMGTPGRQTSYDSGIINTNNVLKSCGYDSRVFSSHMPQIINKRMAELVYGRMVHPNARAMCEWTLYFNIFSYLYPDHCCLKNYTTMSWPCAPTDWIPSKLPDNYFFENYYKSNYEEDGLFYGMPVIGAFDAKCALWHKTFAKQFRQRDLNQQQFNCDNPEIIVSDDCIQVNFTTWNVLKNQLLRINIVDKTLHPDYAQLSISLLHGKKILRREQVSPLAGWVPIFQTDLATGILIELFVHNKQDRQARQLIDQANIKLDFVNKLGNKMDNKNSNTNQKMTGRNMTKQQLMTQLLKISDNDLFARKAYLLILGRKPLPEELRLMLTHLEIGTLKKDIIVNMLLSREKRQNRNTGIELTWLEKNTLFIWKKCQGILSRLKAVMKFSQSGYIQNKSFDNLIFDLKETLESQSRHIANVENQITNMQNQITNIQTSLFDELNQIKSKALFFQQQEAQAHQRRLDQFFFDVKQELRLPESNPEKLGSITKKIKL